MPRHNYKTGSTPRGGRGFSAFSHTRMAEELHELLDIPLDSTVKKNSKSTYQEPNTGRRILDSIIKVLVDNLQRGESIRVNGFGTFYIRDRKEWHTGNVILVNNPRGKSVRSGKSMRVPPKQVVSFKPSNHLLAMINMGDGMEPTYQQRRAMKSWN